jgi:hypothetical protein
MSAASKNPTIKDLKNWTKEALFNKHSSVNLAERISLVPSAG